MQLDILCQQHYGEYGGDPYEARVYFDSNPNTYLQALVDIKNFCKKLDKYDPIHGYHFDIYLDHQEIGWYDKDIKEFKLNNSLIDSLINEILGS
jgi:hypothetical protein